MKRKWVWLIVFVLYFIMIKYMLHVFLPFLLAVLCFFIIKPWIDHLENLFHIQRNAIGISLLLLFYIVMVGLVVMAIMLGIMYCLQWLKELPFFYQNVISPFLEDISSYLQSHSSLFIESHLLEFIQSYSQQFILQLMNALSNFLSHIPQYLFTFFLFLISSFFLVIEYDQIKMMIMDMSRDAFLKPLIFMKERSLYSLKLYIKCQIMMMFIVFFVLFCGFSLLRIHDAFLLAMITAFCDSLPFIGIGIVLLPLCVVYCLQRAYLKAFYLCLLYLMMNMIRSLFEAHIMKKEMKIPSFLLLLSMVIHFEFFGFIGIILSPIHINLLYSFLYSKTIHFKE